MLLLRAAVGIASLVQGGLFIADQTGAVLENWTVGLALAGSGGLLLVGFLTPLAGVLVALITLAVGVSWFRPPATNLFDAPLPIALVVAVAASVAFLGPGSFSLDCRLFGRREIIIPRTPHSHRS
jgi:uncharacterized membrane protein YphA (DoxX/SURF4 family)